MARLWNKRILVFGLTPVLALVAVACSGGGDDDPYRIGVMESLTGPGETYGTVASQAKQMAVDEINAAGGVDGRTLGARRRGLQVRRPGRHRRVQEADPSRRAEDHPGHVVQRRHAGSRPACGGRRDHPVLRVGEQPGHRQGRRLHLPHPDQRHRGGDRHREYAVGRRGPHAGDHHGVDRLRGGRQAHVRGAIRGAGRHGGGSGAVPAGGYRLQVAADEADRGESRRAAPCAAVRVLGGHHRQAGPGAGLRRPHIRGDGLGRDDRTGRSRATRRRE